MVEKPEQPTPRSEDMNLEEDLPGRNGFFASEYGEWTTYDYVDPATGEVEDKQLLMVSHDRLMFGSGWHDAVTTENSPGRVLGPQGCGKRILV